MIKTKKIFSTSTFAKYFKTINKKNYSSLCRQLKIKRLMSKRQKTLAPAKDHFAEMQTIESKRRQNDMIYNLLTNENETELERHILGIVAAANTTENNRAGILQQLYGASLGPVALHTLQVAQDSLVLPQFLENTTLRRIQQHFLLFVTLATSNEFVQYIMQVTQNKDSMCIFMQQYLQPRLAKLLRDDFNNNRNLDKRSNKQTTTLIKQFVWDCIENYMQMCMPK